MSTNFSAAASGQFDKIRSGYFFGRAPGMRSRKIFPDLLCGRKSSFYQTESDKSNTLPRSCSFAVFNRERSIAAPTRSPIATPSACARSRRGRRPPAAMVASGETRYAGAAARRRPAP